jgi:hypothetical protein
LRFITNCKLTLSPLGELTAGYPSAREMLPIYIKHLKNLRRNGLQNVECCFLVNPYDKLEFIVEEFHNLRNTVRTFVQRCVVSNENVYSKLNGSVRGILSMAASSTIKSS